jgi:phosphate starvation-inducible PhoH-like protein
MADPVSRSLTLDSREEAILLFGNRDQFLRLVRDALGVRVVARGDTVQIDGSEEAVGQAERAFAQMRSVLRANGQLTSEDVKTVVEVVRAGSERLSPQNLTMMDGGKYLRPRTDGQGRYVQALRDNDVTICIGPAGTGKTFLAVGMAVTLLRQGAVKKIVLVRPAVEAGERLGFLPGDLVAKINPYLRPLLDSLNDLIEYEQVKKYMETEVIEIVPLAYMRGRAQPVTSPVLTPDGFRPIGSLRVGDSVIGSDGRPTRVEGVYPQGVKDVYRVTLTDRSSTRCCGEHLWTVYTRDAKRRGQGPKVVQTSEMIGQVRCHHYHRFEAPLLSEPVEFAGRRVPLDPYALGLLLGDGCLTGKTTPTFATADAELVGALQERLPRNRVWHKGGVDYFLSRASMARGRTPNPLTNVLRELGLCGTRSGTKFVPETYLHNSADIRLGVLQGLLDTDGGPVTQDGRTCRIQYTTMSERLKNDVLFIVRSLGGVATCRRRLAEGRKPGWANGRPLPYRGDAFILDIRLPPTVAPFRLRRKATRYEACGGGRPMRYVHAIEPDGQDETVCIRVAAADSLYVTDDFILTHNTLNNAVIILDEGQNASTGQMKMFLTRMGMNSKIIVTGDITQIDLPPTLKSGLIDAMHRLKGIPRLGIIQLDESDIVRHALVQQIVKAYEEGGGKHRR